MKMKMKEFYTMLLLGGMALSASAQHLPNVGFDSWKGSGNAGSTYQSSKSGLTGSTNAGMRQRPGDEPTEWFGGSINQKVMGLEKKQELLYKVTDKDNTWVKMTNTFVGVANIGSVAPGFLNFGTPWVYAVSDISKCDGGTYGGRSFTSKPDAVAGRFKKTPVATEENSYIIAYLWSGTFTSQIASTSTKDADRLRDDVDRAILGSVSKTGVTAPSNVTNKGKLIAWCNHSYKTTKNKDWETIEVPLNYEDVNAVPEKMNVIVSSGDYYTRGNLQDGTVVEVDDLDFVYWNTLSSLTYDGAELLEGDKTAYTVDAVYDAAKLVATAKSLFGTTAVNYDEASAVATVTVTRENAEVKTYTIQFKAPVAKATATLTLNGTAGWGTFVAPFNVAIPSDINAYTVANVKEKGELVLMPVKGGNLVANIPVVIKGSSDVNQTFEGEAVSGNPTRGLLTGVYTPTPAPVGSYVLQKQGNRVGFYLVDDVQPTIQPNRCYLTLPAGSSARALFFEEDDLVTALDNAIIVNEPEAAFDLQGRRVNVAGQKGMFIIGGRKVIK